MNLTFFAFLPRSQLARQRRRHGDGEPLLLRSVVAEPAALLRVEHYRCLRARRPLCVLFFCLFLTVGRPQRWFKVEVSAEVAGVGWTTTMQKLAHTSSFGAAPLWRAKESSTEPLQVSVTRQTSG